LSVREKSLFDREQRLIRKEAALIRGENELREARLRFQEESQDLEQQTDWTGRRQSRDKISISLVSPEGIDRWGGYMFRSRGPVVDKCRRSRSISIDVPSCRVQ
jgi:hypothetical protein